MLLSLILFTLCIWMMRAVLKRETPRWVTFPLEQNTQHECQKRPVYCVDACDFLCQEDGMQCVNNICTQDAPPVCNEAHGGRVVMTLEPGVGPRWVCVCHYPHVFTGATCDTRNPLFCEKGRVLPPDECECLFPHVKLRLPHFTYCTQVAGWERYRPMEVELGDTSL